MRVAKARDGFLGARLAAIPEVTCRMIGLRRLAFAHGLLLALFAFSAAVYPEDMVLREGLAIGSMGRAGRSAFHTDAVEEAIVLGKWQAPRAGDTVARTDGTNRTWKALTANEEGLFTGPEMRGGYLYCSVVLEAPAVKILQASGHNLVYVNGEPRAGDPYSNGNLELPVALHQGTNDLLFLAGRGRVKARLVEPKSSAFLSARDLTLPDIIRGEVAEIWGAVPVINATAQALTNLALFTASAGSAELETPLPAIPPMTVRKVPFRIRPVAPANTNAVAYTATLRSRGVAEASEWDTAKIGIRVRNATEHYKQTFRSDIDGSVQYYAVVPPNPLPTGDAKLALFLSTHGASVEAMGQAEAYAPKTWGYLVAPTNRRPYGFDWEDWGRMDALEVLAIAQAKFCTDPAQTYLTGHSMGGHGAWQLGVTFPDRFAAVAPSAGWISFFSYGGGRRLENPDPIEALIQRANTGSDTLALASNYLQQAIYILHGDKDDNVPVTEARRMKERLTEFHRDFMYHEQPEAGHWWGNQCVDWPPIFDLFARRKIPASSAVSRIRFSTANPAVSSSNHWVTIEAQEHSLARSSVDIFCDPGSRKFIGTTENVARLSLKTSPFNLSGAIAIELDGDKLEAEPTSAGLVRLEKRDDRWTGATEPTAVAKNPLRAGPFKEAFKHRMLFVYATRGSAEENAWAYAKARYDAESWFYRGNGAVDAIPDTQFNPTSEPDRSVILYGNAESNSAWPALLAASPVQVSRTGVKIGARAISGDDLACLFVRPRPGSQIASVAVVSGTGLPGARLTERVPYFLAGVAFPDCTVFGADTLRDEAKGVRAAGFFGNDWSVEKGDFAWRE